MKKKLMAFLILALLLSACAHTTPPEDLPSAEETTAIDTADEPALPAEPEGAAEPASPTEPENAVELAPPQEAEDVAEPTPQPEPKQSEPAENTAANEVPSGGTPAEAPRPEEPTPPVEDGPLTPSVEAFQGKWVDNWNTWNTGEYWEFRGNEFYYEYSSTFWAHPWDYDENGNKINKRDITIYSLNVNTGTFDIIDGKLCLTILTDDKYTRFVAEDEADPYNDNETTHTSEDLHDEPSVWSPRPITEITADYYITSETLRHERVGERPTLPYAEWGFEDPYISW